MKRIISTCLIAVLLMLSVVPINASGIKGASTGKGIVSPMYYAIWSMSAGLSINSLGRATCSGSVTPSKSTYSASMTVTLEKYKDNKWTAIMSWSDTGVGYTGVIIEARYYVVSGRYRVRNKAYIFNAVGDLLETATVYSEEEIY